MRTSRACRTSRASLDGSAARIRTGTCFTERVSWLFASMEAAAAWVAAHSCGRQARMLTKMHDSVQLRILGIDEPSGTCLNCSATSLVLRKACGQSTAGCSTRAVKPATTWTRRLCVSIWEPLGTMPYLSAFATARKPQAGHGPARDRQLQMCS